MKKILIGAILASSLATSGDNDLCIFYAKDLAVLQERLAVALIAKNKAVAKAKLGMYPYLERDVAKYCKGVYSKKNYKSQIELNRVLRKQAANVLRQL